MAVQKVFKRYEYKYLLTREQKELLQNVMEEYMIPDEYGRSTICNLYFDTPQYLLIRRSIENKVYKEKVRLRTYGRSLLDEDQSLLEIKVGHAIPLWLSHFLTENKIFRTSYSKYGNAYRTLLREGEINYA
ncbi:VTC domain-containing protein [Mediterraneibacter sp.]